jgi:hypothetical protein
MLFGVEWWCLDSQDHENRLPKTLFFKNLSISPFCRSGGPMVASKKSAASVL